MLASNISQANWQITALFVVGNALAAEPVAVASFALARAAFLVFLLVGTFCHKKLQLSIKDRKTKP
jgi:hypothetical protein